MASKLEITPLSEEEIEKILAGFNEKDHEKLTRFTEQAEERSGVIGIRRGGPTWNKLRDGVLSDIYGQGMTIREIEERED